MNVLAAVRSIVRGGAMTSRARGQEDLASLLEDALSLLDEELSRRNAVRGRSTTRRAASEKPVAADDRSLSLFNDQIQERETEREIRVTPAREPTPTESPPPVRADDLLTVGRQLVAERAHVADPQACWAAFCGYFAGQRIEIDRRWATWVGRERNRAPPQSETRIRAAPRIDDARREREQREAHERLKREAVAPPAEFLSVLGRLAKTQPPEQPVLKSSIANGA